MKLKFKIKKGGPGSGFHGHEGRPGKRGGSSHGKGLAQNVMSVREANKQFPSTMKAIVEVGLMNDAGSVRNDFEIPSKYVDTMTAVEPLFTDAKRRKAGEIPRSKFPSDYDEYDSQALDSMMTILAGGEELFQNAVIEYYETKNMPGKLASGFLYEVFDGELNEMLEY